MAANIPIVTFKRLLDSLIEYIRSNLEAKIIAGLEEESFLYQVLNGNNSDGFDFYEEGKNIFSRQSTSSRKIETRLMFTKDIAPTPTVHVREPAKIKGIFNTIGGIDNTRIDLQTGYLDQYRDTKKATYEFVCTSDNPLEAVLISEVIYAALLSAHETLVYLGFAIFDYGMKELIANNELIPYPLFIKSIELIVQYENTIPSIQTAEMCDIINFELSRVDPK
jgi:hypothetical protein